MQTLRIGSRGNDVKILQRALNLYDDGIFGKLTLERVKEYQKSVGLYPDGIVGDKTWEKLLNGKSQISVSKRKITEIIVHCTATQEGKNFTVSDITRWHKQRGFSTIGYHYVIYIDGSLHLGRNIDISGAHCENHNSHSIGVCYVGGLASDGKTPKDTRTQAQKTALVALLRGLRRVYPMARIYGHRDFANKACPSFDAKREYSTI
jgi:N-acetylmuramoyl-L-alanine amidase